MKNIFMMEIRRSLRSRGMILALVIGIALSLMQVIQNQLPMYQANLTKFYEDFPILPPSNVSEVWIAGNAANLAGFVYFLVFPILAALPFGTSYFDDNRSGFLKGIYMRVPRRQYLAAKYVASLLSGGIAVVIPLIVNLMLALVLFPNLLPNAVYSMSGMGASRMFYEIYYSHPMLYALIFLGIDFLMGGMWACVALAASYLSDYKIIVLISPFFIQLVIHVMCTMLNRSDYSSVYFTRAGYGIKYGWVVIAYLLVGSLAALVIFRKKGEKEDVF